MKTGCVVFVISILFITGLSVNVLAVSDTTSDNLIPNVDLISASVVTSDKEGSAQTPDTMNIGIKMAPGSHLPGAVIFDFDVDNDTATGGGSIITGIPAGNCGSEPCKTPAGDGFDFYVVLVLRTQGDTSNLSLASGCTGSALTCAERGAATSCNEGTCYELGDPCSMGDSDCYEIEEGGACTGCAGGATGYPLANICGTTGKDCSQRLIKGEYYVGYGSQNSVMVGNIPVRNTFNINNETELCASLNWGLMITQVYTRILRDAPAHHPLFDSTYANDNPPKYQVSVFYDEDFADEDDLFTLPGLNVDIADWMPDTARAADGEYNDFDPCGHNTVGGYGDQNVDANDLSDFLAEFGRSIYCLGCGGSCPNCKEYQLCFAVDEPYSFILPVRWEIGVYMSNFRRRGR